MTKKRPKPCCHAEPCAELDSVSFQHLVKVFSAFGRHTFHPRPQDGVFRCNLNKIILSNLRDSHRNDISIQMVKGGRIIPNFIGNYEHFSREVNLKRLLEEYRFNKVESMTIFRDKIVIIGGTFDKKDFYLTPIGRM